MSTWLAKSKAKVVNFHFIQEKPFIFYHLSYKYGHTKASPLNEVSIYGSICRDAMLASQTHKKTILSGDAFNASLQRGIEIIYRHRIRHPSISRHCFQYNAKLHSIPYYYE